MTTTPNKGLTQPTYNSTAPTWDVPLNANFGVIDSSLGSTLALSLSSTNVALSAAQVQNMRIAVSGALLASVSVSIPSGVGGFWIVSNGCSGAFSVTVTSAGGGASVAVPQGYSTIVWSDGTNIGLADNGAASLSAVPPGMLMPYGGASAPSGWLPCDGAAISRTTYAPLYVAIGTAWGPGDGSTTFNVPPLSGAFLRGSGLGLNPVSRAVGSYQADALGTHTHGVTDPGHTHAISPAGGNVLTSGASGALSAFAGVLVSTLSILANFTGITINSAGGAETTPKNYAALYCIKT